MLLVKVISTPYPPRKEPPENVICGPGLLLQSYAEKSAEMATGIGRLVLLMWGNDDDDAANDGDVMGALDDPSVHAPTRKSAPSRAAALRSVPVHMVASLSLKVVADYDDVAGPSDWHGTPGPACVGARGIPGEVGANCTLCTHPVAARARQHRGTSATTEFSITLGALPRVPSKRLLLFVRGDQGRRPNAVASARRATARARASLPGCGRPGSTSKARQGESDHAIANTAPQRRQRRVGAESTTGLRSQQLGQTAYLPSSEVGAASSGLRRTSDHMGGRSGRICRKARGTRNRRLLTSSTVSPRSAPPPDTTPRGAAGSPSRPALGPSIALVACALPEAVDVAIASHNHGGCRGIGTVTSDTRRSAHLPTRAAADEGPAHAAGRVS